jgi:hypothetical protein
MLTHYSRALDEIYRQRQAAAYEAHVITGVLTFASLPKGARVQLEALRERLWLTARGEDCYDHVDSELRQRVMAIARMPKALTRHQWEATRGPR